jgi:hypothetical protein
MTPQIETTTAESLPNDDGVAKVDRAAPARRIAIVALALSAVIGIAGPVIAWMAARDSTREAAERARVEADIEDVRDILDVAIVDLNALRARAEGRILHPDQAHRQTFNVAVATATADALMIEMRLGETTPFTSYDAAVTRFKEVGRIVLDCDDRHELHAHKEKVAGRTIYCRPQEGKQEVGWRSEAGYKLADGMDEMEQFVADAGRAVPSCLDGDGDGLAECARTGT